jgi:kumamolisin
VATGVFHPRGGAPVSGSQIERLLQGDEAMAESKWVVLPASKRAVLRGARVVGPADPGEIIDVTVRVRHASGSKPLAETVKALAATPVHARRHLSREEYAAAHGADQADLEKVMAYASRHGLSAHSPSIGRRSVHLVGTAAAMTAAFGVNLQRYQVGELSYRGNADHVQVPEELSGIVEAVVGFDTRPHARPHFRMRKAAGGPKPFNPPQLAKIYNFPADVDGTGQVIGILELGSPHGSGYRLAELEKYFKTELGLKKVPTVIAASVDGAHNQPGTNPDDPQCADGEVALDIEVAGAIAPGAKIVVYFAPNTGQGFLDLITTAVHDEVNKPTVLSLSWGGPEDSTDPTTNQINAALQAAAAMGITVCVASGDNGSSDDPNASSPAQVDFPASSPFALGCGGTELTASGTTISSEVVWNEPSGGASGGGISRIFDLPDYQAKAGVPAAVDPDGPVRRGVPDVSGDADPNSGYNILVDGHAMPIGGTSAVAPLWAGLVTLLNQKLGKPVGFLNPILYANPGGLRDITEGSNGDYKAGRGWDPCTGLGTPDGMALLKILSGTPAGGPKKP